MAADPYKYTCLLYTSTGNIYDCVIPTVPADPNSGYFGRIMKLADKYKKLGVRTNADTPACLLYTSSIRDTSPVIEHFMTETGYHNLKK